MKPLVVQRPFGKNTYIPAGCIHYHFYGLDWRNKKNAFAERVWTATVLRTVAGIVIYDPAGEPGTSGSCVLNEDGQVVAVNTGGMLVGPREARALGHGNEVGIGVGVWLGLGAAN